jgi:SHAQKYF class myb-like DNA-binding protein
MAPVKGHRKPYKLMKQRERWTDEEHQRFLEAVSRYGRNWKDIVAFVGTRTVAQVRSHAQKYFIKLEKSGRGDAVPPARPKKRSCKNSTDWQPADKHQKLHHSNVGGSSSEAQSSGLQTGSSGVGSGSSSQRRCHPTAAAALAVKPTAQAQEVAKIQAEAIEGQESSHQELSNSDSCHDNSAASSTLLEVPQGITPMAHPQLSSASEEQTYVHPGQAGEAENSSHNELYTILVSLMSRPYTPEEQLALMKHLEPQQREQLFAMMRQLTGSLQSAVAHQPQPAPVALSPVVSCAAVSSAQPAMSSPSGQQTTDASQTLPCERPDSLFNQLQFQQWQEAQQQQQQHYQQLLHQQWLQQQNSQPPPQGLTVPKQELFSMVNGQPLQQAATSQQASASNPQILCKRSQVPFISSAPSCPHSTIKTEFPQEPTVASNATKGSGVPNVPDLQADSTDALTDDLTASSFGDALKAADSLLSSDCLDLAATLEMPAPAPLDLPSPTLTKDDFAGPKLESSEVGWGNLEARNAMWASGDAATATPVVDPSDDVSNSIIDSLINDI